MRNVAHQLDAACKRQGLPIVGVSIGRVGDRQTWRINYLPEATEAEQAEGQRLIDAYDPTNDLEFAQEQRRAAARDAVDRQDMRALLRLLAQRLGVSVSDLRQELRASHEAEAPRAIARRGEDL